MFPASLNSAAFSDENTILPVAAPGDAAKPEVNNSALANASSLNTGCNNWSIALTSIEATASSLVNKPSPAISTAILIPAAPVRLPLRVCNKNNFPSSIVNSTSCIS